MAESIQEDDLEDIFILNKAELATDLEVSLPTVDAWVRRGCPVLERGGLGRPYRFDWRDVVEWLGRRNRMARRHRNWASVTRASGSS
jgi:phage terminase Nu1 subunit (DNA packaging protein)